jgi:integrase
MHQTPKTIREFMAEYAMIKDVRPGTLSQYEYVLLSLADYLKRDPLISDLNRHAVNGWLVYLQQEREFSVYTLKSRRMTILSIWRLAAELEYCDPPRSVFIRKIKTPDRTIDVLSMDDVRSLLDVLSQDRRKLRGYDIIRGDYLRAAAMAIMETPLRPSDLHKLDYEEVMDARGHFQIVQVKTGHRRWVRFSKHLLADIRFWHPGNGRIWPVVHRTMLTNNFRKAGLKLGLRVNHTILRKTSITLVESRHPGLGWIHAGHKSPSTTQGWYTNADIAYKNLPAMNLWGIDQ